EIPAYMRQISKSKGTITTDRNRVSSSAIRAGPQTLFRAPYSNSPTVTNEIATVLPPTTTSRGNLKRVWKGGSTAALSVGIRGRFHRRTETALAGHPQVDRRGA